MQFTSFVARLVMAAGPLCLLASLPACAQLGGPSRPEDLVIAPGKQAPIIVVSPRAGTNEKAAAADLARYIQMMCGVQSDVAQTDAEIAEALAAQDERVLLIIGQAALEADPSLQKALDEAAKKDPELRADAIVLRRKGNRVYVTGNNDEAHYYAVSQLLQWWGCRWYIPTEFGECIPELEELRVGELDYAYGTPFESRLYWISWNGDGSGAAEFRLRNFMSSVYVPNGHVLATYVTDLIPEGKTHFNVAISDPETAEHVAKQVVDRFGRGEHVMMGMEDGAYASDYELDAELQAGLYDKHFQTAVLTDPFMVFYNNLAGHLMAAHPDSPAKIGFLAYVNITLPPQRDIVAAKPLICYLAPIDVDPTHGMDDHRSPPRQEYRDVMYRWSEVMQGRVAIYDYDQGMLIWRDIPNPSHMAFREDVKHYRDAGILGVATESRNAIGTVFLNLYLRGQLMWNPDADVDALLAEFYPKFYGPAAKPMERYWSAIYTAWEDTIATEHEYFVAPTIYTAELVEELRGHLAAADRAVEELEAKPAEQLTTREKQVLDRMKFTRLSFGIIDNYMAMVRAASTDADYEAAAAAGETALALREEMTKLNGIFTTYRLPGQEGIKVVENGPYWFYGERQQYAALSEYTDGTKGELLAKLPLEWPFRRDPNDTGLERGYAQQKADLAYWKANKARFATPASRKDYPTTEWEVLRTDLYPGAQGVLHPDWQNLTGFLWYKADVDLEADQTEGKVHVRFPGLFNEAWLYVNGYLVAHRPQHHMWWHNDYSFEWDVDLSGKLKPGRNDITLRVQNTHHLAGMFRRPFLYRSVEQ